MLTAEQIKARDGLLTASRVACLMTGDAAKILNLWRELVGDPEFVEEDLSAVWPVQLGGVTEHLNLDWYERKYNPVVRRGEVVVHDCGWAAATLDGWDSVLKCPIETKHVGGFEKMDVIVSRYMPQLHWQMIVTRTKSCILSVIHGAQEPVIVNIQFDTKYGAELWSRAEQFMECVNNLTPPLELPPLDPPAKAIKEYDYTTNNAWCAAAADFLETKRHAELNGVAKDLLKDMVPRDAHRVFGHGLEAKRDKANRIHIGEIK